MGFIFWPKQPREHLIIPLDGCETLDDAKRLIDLLVPYADTFKVGLELITKELAGVIGRHVYASGARLMYDGKFSDIPNTVASAVKRVAENGHYSFTIHANCGRRSLEAAAKVKGNSHMLAVTILTSMKGEDLIELGYNTRSGEILFNPDLVTLKVSVWKMASMAVQAGADGIICSPLEIGLIKPIAHDLLKIVPGVRPIWADKNDQKRIMTPGAAIKAGANCVVIGRPITQADDPVEAAKRILDEIAQAKA